MNKRLYYLLYIFLCISGIGIYSAFAAYNRTFSSLNLPEASVSSIPAYKVILKEEGIIKTTKMRRPMENLTLEQEKALLNRMRELDYKKVLV